MVIQTKKQILSENISNIKKQLPQRGAYGMISKMINGAYTANTVKAMMNQTRTMNPGVLAAAEQLIELMNPPTPNTEQNETNE